MNSSRGNDLLGEVPVDRARTWYRAESIDEWAERGPGVFEQRDRPS